jgi:hypothetical protein
MKWKKETYSLLEISDGIFKEVNLHITNVDYREDTSCLEEHIFVVK